MLVRTLPVEHRVSGGGEVEYRVFGPVFYLEKKKKNPKSLSSNPDN